MRLQQFHIDGDEYFINPDKIKHMRTKCTGLHGQIKCTLITFIDSEEILVDETLKTVIARINNDELNVAYDCMGEIERVKEKIKRIERNTQPSAI
jgi:uncharacterized protein YlzI (FlbEa/FlbD family)